MEEQSLGQWAETERRGERETGGRGDLCVPVSPVSASHSQKLPFHRAFFGCIDFRGLRDFTEQKAFDVVEKKVLRIRRR